VNSAKWQGNEIDRVDSVEIGQSGQVAKWIIQARLNNPGAIFGQWHNIYLSICLKTIERQKLTCPKIIRELTKFISGDH